LIYFSAGGFFENLHPNGGGINITFVWKILGIFNHRATENTEWRVKYGIPL